MGLAYGTALKRDGGFEGAEQKARDRHAHYYTDAPGWLYRAEAVSYAAISPWADEITGDGEWYSTDPSVEIFAYPVLRYTPCGATIRNIWRDGTKWVNLEPGAKQFASRTAKEAVEALRQRRKAQVYILGKQMRRAQREIDLCDQVLSQTPLAMPSV